MERKKRKNFSLISRYLKQFATTMEHDEAAQVMFAMKLVQLEGEVQFETLSDDGAKLQENKQKHFLAKKGKQNRV